MADLGDKSSHFSGVLETLRRLDAARHVDAPGAHGADRPADIGGIEAAGKDERPPTLARGERPVEAFTGATVFRHEAVEQPCRGAGIRLEVGERLDSGPDAARLDE